jgi:ABC-2 type transport system ATP-binding protein
MGQRLGIATALLGDPHTIMLDEPVNGLDPEGVLWVRTLARQLAAEGRTVFLSSHLMSEMAKTADHLIVLGRGKVIADAPIQEVIDRASLGTVRVRTPEADTLARLLQAANATVNPAEPGVLEVVGRPSEDIGQIAASAGIVLHQLTSLESSLEDAYLQLTADAVEYHSAALDASSPMANPSAGSPDTTHGATAPIMEGALR